MKSLVLDTNELAKDFMCVSLRYRLLEYAWDSTWVEVYVPAAVIEEAVATYTRAVEHVRARPELVERERGRLGLHIVGELTADQYREYLLDRFDRTLGFTVLPWPDVSHEELVKRAAWRTPPFNQKGGGYRDSLIWADVCRLARDGHDVVLVSQDDIFRGLDGGLAEALVEEVTGFDGTVALTPELGPWLLNTLPWAAGDMSMAVANAQEVVIAEELMATDPWDEQVPRTVDFGFDRPPYDVVIDDLCWDGTMTKKSGAIGPDGIYIATYDLHYTVAVIATLSAVTDAREERWATTVVDPLGQAVVTGEVLMLQRIAVLFGSEASLDIEVVGWRRADGVPPGADLYRPEWDPEQLRLFEAAVSGAGDATWTIPQIWRRRPESD